MLFDGLLNVLSGKLMNFFELAEAFVDSWCASFMEADGEARIVSEVCEEGRHADGRMVGTVVRVFR